MNKLVEEEENTSRFEAENSCLYLTDILSILVCAQNKSGSEKYSRQSDCMYLAVSCTTGETYGNLLPQYSDVQIPIRFTDCTWFLRRTGLDAGLLRT